MWRRLIDIFAMGRPANMARNVSMLNWQPSGGPSRPEWLLLLWFGWKLIIHWCVIEIYKNLVSEWENKIKIKCVTSFYLLPITSPTENIRISYTVKWWLYANTSKNIRIKWAIIGIYKCSNSTETDFFCTVTYHLKKRVDRSQDGSLLWWKNSLALHCKMRHDDSRAAWENCRRVGNITLCPYQVYCKS